MVGSSLKKLNNKRKILFFHFLHQNHQNKYSSNNTNNNNYNNNNNINIIDLIEIKIILINKCVISIKLLVIILLV